MLCASMQRVIILSVIVLNVVFLIVVGLMELMELLNLASRGSSTEVEHLLHHPKVKGSRPTSASASGTEGGRKSEREEKII